MQRTLFDCGLEKKPPSTTPVLLRQGRKRGRPPPQEFEAEVDVDAAVETEGLKPFRLADLHGAVCISVEEDVVEAEPRRGPREDSFSRQRQRLVVRSSSTWLVNLLPTEGEWSTFLLPLTHDSFQQKLFARIEAFLEAFQKAKSASVLYPPLTHVFEAFCATPFAKLKVILLGQDPYHQPGQAHGLSFSVSPGVPPPPSLRNMYQELSNDIPGFQTPPHGYLRYWAEQGMLLLNATLTVERGQPNSHAKCGWGEFTDAVLERLSTSHPHRLVFLLWGKFAEKKQRLIDERRHVVLVDCHPSPLSAHRGWFGCKVFSRCNAALTALGHEPMDWQLPLTVGSGN